MRKPDFENIELILNKEKPHRRTIFEFSINFPLLEKLVPGASNVPEKNAEAWKLLGFDFAVFWNYLPKLPKREHESAKTYSLNDCAMIDSWESLEKYPWPDIEKNDYSEIFDVKLPDGMKILAHAPDGLQENLISLLGYDNLCMLLYDDYELVRETVDRIGAYLYRHYERCLESKLVGACFINDDWGFAQQPMLPPDEIRKLIVPWTQKMVELVHSAGIPAIQHSCGNCYDCKLIEDVIEVCKFDGRHSYEDKILPVEQAYKLYHRRLAILGGMDVGFLCVKSPEEIRQRATAMLESAEAEGSYALGSGNSIPDYVPPENFFAMLEVATEIDYSRL